MKRKYIEWEKIFSNDVTDKGLISKIGKQLIQFINNNNKNPKQPNQKMDRKSKQTFLQRTQITKKYSQCHVLSYVWLFATPWTVAHQAPLSMEFSRQEYWSGLPFLLPGHLPDPGIEPESPASPTLWVGSLPIEPSGKPTDSQEAHEKMFNFAN